CGLQGLEDLGGELARALRPIGRWGDRDTLRRGGVETLRDALEVAAERSHRWISRGGVAGKAAGQHGPQVFLPGNPERRQRHVGGVSYFMDQLLGGFCIDERRAGE